MAKGDTSQSGYFPGVYHSALGQTADDYDNIMKQYQQLAGSQSSYSPIAPPREADLSNLSSDERKEYLEIKKDIQQFKRKGGGEEGLKTRIERWKKLMGDKNSGLGVSSSGVERPAN